MKSDALVSGFNAIDLKRIENHLEKLLPYINTDNLAIVGGLAIRYFLTQGGIKYPTRRFNDVDLMIKTVGEISPKIAENFLIYHYHPPKKGYFFIALVDPVSKIKVDFFDWHPPLEDYIIVKFGKYKLKMRSAEDQLVKTVCDIQRISLEKKVDPKQFLDAKLLMRIADLEFADILWKKRNFSSYPISIVAAYEKANNIALKHPEWVQEHPFKRPKPFNCPDCRSTKEFKITPMGQIYETLGYIE